MKTNSLKSNIWLYLIILTFGIIIFLCFFQIVFIDTYYEHQKTKLIKKTANNIVNSDIDKNILDKLSFENDVCIEIINDYTTIYSSNSVNKGCVLGNYEYKINFYNSGKDSETFKLINPRFDNKTLVYATKLDNDNYLFVNASLEPLNTTVLILSQQLIVVSIIVLILALLIGYYISRKISKPIEKMNKQASLLGSGQYDFTFDHSSIKEINELSETLNYAKEELKQTDDLRRDLLANVSHDLKTPLTMIKGYAEMAKDLNGNNKQKREENLNIIIEETDRLNNLVEDILALSKMQANKDTLNIEQFDLIKMINSIIKRYDILQMQENYVFSCHMPNTLLVKADYKKIEQVIYNLINNAINYTGEDNKITISVSGDEEILVEIQDTGKGIDEYELAHIWDKYYHSQKKHKRNKVGTGLGLSIVKNILEAHHFQYGVKSKKGSGTTFYFIIK